MPRERRVIAAALTSKGFREDKTDHKKYWLYHNGQRQAISTMLSHGSGYKTIDDSLLGKIAKQLKLKKADLLELVDCSMDGARYIQTLVAQGVDLKP